MPKADLRPLEEIFRAGVFTMLKEEGKITDEIIDKLMKWRHSGFSINNGLRITRTYLNMSRSVYRQRRGENVSRRYGKSILC